MSSNQCAGSCLCGNVQIKLSAEPIAVALCHCRDCQKQTGTSFSLVALVPASAVQITGTTAMFATRGDSGDSVERTFCPKCGSPVRTDSSTTRQQGITILKAGLLDNAGELQPALQIYCDSAHSWLPDLAPMARFAKMPPR